MQRHPVCGSPIPARSYRLRCGPLQRPWLAILLALACAAFGLPPTGPAFAAARAPAESARGMVVTSEAGATRAGLAMLEAGGNAVDAAVAVAFALGVTQPFSAGLGGGAFALIRLADGRVVALDARETAPAAATRTMYVQPGVAADASVVGALAVATPGFTSGMVLALEQYGTLPLAKVLAPAIALAERGFPIAPYHARMIEVMRGRLSAERFPETARIQFPPPGQAAHPGWVLVQRDLARTLREIAKHGAAGFSGRRVAKAIDREVRRRGGILTAADMKDYRPVLRAPVSGAYRGLDVHSFPPPSSGGVVLLEMLNILEHFDLAKRGAGSSDSVHVVAEAMKLAFADRAAYMGDPDFVDIPVPLLVSKTYGRDQAGRLRRPWYTRAPWNWFRPPRPLSVPGPGLLLDDHGTVHLSVTDSAGNAVALTMSINTLYGSGITVPGTGVLLNNEMDDFSAAENRPNAYGLVDTRGANAIAPGKRPLSSMTPTVLVKDGVVFMVTGSPGGPRIITTALLSILNVVDYGMNVQEAVSAPRFHHQWLPDRLRLEPDTPADVVRALRRRGHPVDVSERTWSAAEAIVIDPATGRHQGGSDPRRGGLALGY